MTDRLRLYIRYSLRSLRRGGQRTVLAIFCVAVGVMAVVALRLAADMITASLTGNVREANGGDVSVQSVAIPLTGEALLRFDDLQRRGTISRYQAIGVQTAGLRGPTGGTLRLLAIVLDDPPSYPLAGSPHFVSPKGDTYGSALSSPAGIVLTQFTADEIGATTGSTVHFTIEGEGGRDLQVRGIVDNRVAVGGRTVAYISGRTYTSIASRPERYGIVTALTPDTDHADQAARQLREDFPTASVQTVKDALDQNIQTSSQISTFLQIVGLLALLIGGIGVVNTIQVMLSRRSLEIAVLKTTGYRRRDLYALFGLETGILGLAGGVVGTAAGVGVSFVVKDLFERVFAIKLDVVLSPVILATGVAVGLATSLIFGLLPIVRASAVRPQAVLRNLPEGTRMASRLQVAGLYILLIALFTVLSSTLLGSVTTALVTVVAAVVVIALLGLLFAGIAWLIGRIPVPEGKRPLPLIAALLLVALAIALMRRQAALGVIVLLVAASIWPLLLLPRAQRQVTKLALRSLSRARARTSATLVALFVGVFSVGLILVVGLGVRGKIDEAFTKLTDYSVFAIASSRDRAAVTGAVAHL
ncbi:MAG TPA: FtsX-like permease family protein, partial [Candidatus Sulfotelmatobacter sp.]|nr:FtsX-like permease family protein [Candidatus Sulfotelmatobacter sp.]